MDPCGTPEVTFTSADDSSSRPLKATWCYRSRRNDSSHDRTIPSTQRPIMSDIIGRWVDGMVHSGHYWPTVSVE